MVTFDFFDPECLKLFAFIPLFFHLIFISATFISCCEKSSNSSRRQYYSGNSSSSETSSTSKKSIKHSRQRVVAVAPRPVVQIQAQPVVYPIRIAPAPLFGGYGYGGYRGYSYCSRPYGYGGFGGYGGYRRCHRPSGYGGYRHCGRPTYVRNVRRGC
uniref:Uncharacterized protein n=1 Tax=Panagrolaimus sp. PS1159 TaxID=55785 RepID=A0AC35G6K8_9BILA